MKHSILFILFCSITAACCAQDISIKAEVDKSEIALDDQINLTIIVEGSISNIPEPNIPDMKGFGYYSAGRSQNISIINGAISSSVSFEYVLVPNDVGEYVLGPFSINYKGNIYSAEAINVKVIPKGSSQGANTPRYTYPQDKEEETLPLRQEKGKELFITASVDKLTAYVNEQITLTFSFYQSVDLFENPRYSSPQTTGFWTEDMPPQNKYYKVINGTKYLVTEIKTALFATSPGAFVIGSATLEASVEDIDRFMSRRAFDMDPFSMFRKGKPITLTTEPINLNILPLPEDGKPISFKGDVGSFEITSSVDKEKVRQNEPVNLKIKIRGSGNIKTISSPIVPENDAAKFYDSGSQENIVKADYVVQGEKVFEKVIVPRKAGPLLIGPIPYSYFDPSVKEYVEKNIEPITIEVEKTIEPETSGSSAVNVAPGLSKEDIQVLKKDISYIKSYPVRFSKSNDFLYKNKLFIFSHIFALIVVIVLYVFELHRERLKKDTGYARSRMARRIAEKRLKRAKGLLLKENVKDFYGEIYKAVIEYIADKLNIPHPSITKDLLEEKLSEKHFKAEFILGIKHLFDECDMARFASARFSRKDMVSTIEKASNIISDIERQRIK